MKARDDLQNCTYKCAVWEQVLTIILICSNKKMKWIYSLDLYLCFWSLFLSTFIYLYFIFIFIFITFNIREISLHDRMMIRLMDIMQASTSNLLAKYEGNRQYLLLTIMQRFMRRKYSVFRAFKLFTIYTYIYRVIYAETVYFRQSWNSRENPRIFRYNFKFTVFINFISFNHSEKSLSLPLFLSLSVATY